MTDVARFRSQNLVPQLVLNHHRIRTTGPNAPDEKIYKYPTASAAKQMTDTIHPKWESRIESGEVINDPVTYTVSGTSYYPGTFRWTTSNGIYEYVEIGSVEYMYSAGYPNLQLSDPSDIGDLVSDAKLGVLSKIDVAPHDMLEDAFEVEETLKFLRNPLNSLFNISKDFKRSRRWKQKKYKYMTRSKAIANTWLQYRFAAMPLMSSIENYAHSISSARDKRTLFTEHDRQKSTVSGNDIYYRYGKNFERWSLRETEAKATIQYWVSNPVGGWRKTYGFRLYDVPNGLWNIVPLSFMVDRMLNVSDFLRAGINLSNPDLHIRFACVSEKTRNEYYRRIIELTTRINCSNDGSFVKTYDGSYRRNPWNPTYSDTIPRFKPLGLVRSLTSTVDLLALTIQNFK